MSIAPSVHHHILTEETQDNASSLVDHMPDPTCKAAGLVLTALLTDALALILAFGEGGVPVELAVFGCPLVVTDTTGTGLPNSSRLIS